VVLGQQLREARQNAETTRSRTAPNDSRGHRWMFCTVRLFRFAVAVRESPPHSSWCRCELRWLRILVAMVKTIGFRSRISRLPSSSRFEASQLYIVVPRKTVSDRQEQVSHPLGFSAVSSPTDPPSLSKRGQIGSSSPVHRVGPQNLAVISRGQSARVRRQSQVSNCFENQVFGARRAAFNI
jgi:hypothetical protein